MPTTAQRLRQTRHDRGLTLTALAQASGLPRTTIHRAETGKHLPNPRTLRLLAVALAVSEPYLRGETEKPGKPPKAPPREWLRPAQRFRQWAALAHVLDQLAHADLALLLRIGERLRQDRGEHADPAKKEEHTG